MSVAPVAVSSVQSASVTLLSLSQGPQPKQSITAAATPAARAAAQHLQPAALPPAGKGHVAPDWEPGAVRAAWGPLAPPSSPWNRLQHLSIYTYQKHARNYRRLMPSGHPGNGLPWGLHDDLKRGQWAEEAAARFLALILMGLSRRGGGVCRLCLYYC